MKIKPLFAILWYISCVIGNRSYAVGPGTSPPGTLWVPLSVPERGSQRKLRFLEPEGMHGKRFASGVLLPLSGTERGTQRVPGGEVPGPTA